MTDKKQNESKASESEDKTTKERSGQGFSTSISLTPKESPSDAKKQPLTNKAKVAANEKKSKKSTAPQCNAYHA